MLLIEQLTREKILSLEAWGDQLPQGASVFDVPVIEGYVLLVSDNTKRRYNVAVINNPIPPTQINKEEFVFHSMVSKKKARTKYEELKND